MSFTAEKSGRLCWTLLMSLACLATASAAGPRPIEIVPVGSPSSAVARLHNGTGGYCTAALLRPDLAVTAAHCLYNRRTGRWLPPKSIHILLGYDRGDYGFHTTASEYRTGGFDPELAGETLAKDWALLTLAQAAPRQYATLDLHQGAYTPGRLFHMIGFASPRKHALSRTSDCTARMIGSLLASDCQSAAGMSGAPLVDNASGAIIGIQIGNAMAGSERSLSIAVPALNWSSYGME